MVIRNFCFVLLCLFIFGIPLIDRFLVFLVLFDLSVGEEVIISLPIGSILSNGVYLKNGKKNYHFLLPKNQVLGSFKRSLYVWISGV